MLVVLKEQSKAAGRGPRYELAGCGIAPGDHESLCESNGAGGARKTCRKRWAAGRSHARLQRRITLQQCSAQPVTRYACRQRGSRSHKDQLPALLPSDNNAAEYKTRSGMCCFQGHLLGTQHDALPISRHPAAAPQPLTAPHLEVGGFEPEAGCDLGGVPAR